MAQITKDLATKLSIELLSKKKEALDKAKNDLSESVRKEHMKSVPKEMKELFEKYPQAFKTVGVVALIGEGFNFQSVGIDNAPIVNGEWSYNLNVTDKRLKPKWDKWERLNNEYKDSKQIIYNTLLSLRTYAKIAEAFPEIANKLVVNKVETLVNITEVRKLIK